MSNKEKIYGCVEKVFQGLDKNDLLEMPENLSEDTVLIGEGEVLDSVAFVNFFVDLEQELGTMFKKEILLPMEEIQTGFKMNRFYIRDLVSFIEEKYFCD